MNWISVWRYTDEWCEDCALRGSENDIRRRYIPDRDKFMNVSGPQFEPSLAGDGLPRLHSRLRFNLCRACSGCNGTGRRGQWYHFDAETMLSRLTEKQQLVMSYRLGFVDGKQWTQQELAKHLGMSQPGIHKHERLARKKFESVVRQFFDIPRDSKKSRVTKKGCIQVHSSRDGYMSISKGSKSFQFTPEREGISTDESEQPQLKQTPLKKKNPDWRAWRFECYPNRCGGPELWWAAQNGSHPLYAPTAKRLAQKIRTYSA